MAQILIDIDDKTYKALMEIISINLGRSNYKGIIEKCLNAIKHGNVLPKGYGRLIDADKVENITWQEPYYHDALNVLSEVRDKVRELPTIIEADKGGMEGMTIEEHKEHLLDIMDSMPDDACGDWRDSLAYAIEIMRKHQKIQEIVKSWEGDTWTDGISENCMEKISEVMEGGNNNQHN